VTIPKILWEVTMKLPEFRLVYLVLDTGERLPCLVDKGTWLPVRLPTRWAVRWRRYRVQASTLASNLRVLAKVYDWAWRIADLDLDQHLTGGHLLAPQQLESLAAYLRESATLRSETTIAPHTYNTHLAITEDFLKWSLYPANRGGVTPFSLEQLTAEREYLTLFFRSIKVGGGQSQRIQPLTAAEISQIRDAIQLRPGHQGEWQFPRGSFSPQTAFRNWLMFEVAYELGLRRGELLKLRLDSLPRGSEASILVRRLPDDPHDSRAYEPAVKTAERKLPASRNLLQAIRSYITAPPPAGRVNGQSPYLFVSRRGDPISIHTAQDIIRAIGQAGGIQPLSWHRLRHTWAERTATLLLDQPNGIDILMYLGGWSHPASPQRYIQNALASQSAQLLARYQEGLYLSSEEGER
jgi:integrase